MDSLGRQEHVELAASVAAPVVGLRPLNDDVQADEEDQAASRDGAGCALEMASLFNPTGIGRQFQWLCAANAIPAMHSCIKALVGLRAFSV